jgi:hypothetical protein
MIFAFIVLAASASEVSDNAIRQQAALCGLNPHQLVWSVDVDGHRRADLTPNGDMESLAFKSFTCMLDWAKQSGARVRFIAEPAPSVEEVTALREATKKCGLAEGALRFERNEVGGHDIRVNQAPPVAEEQVTCALGRLPDDIEMKYGIGPLSVGVPEQ